MVEPERPHRTASVKTSNNNNATKNELFICFTSRLSSSSSSMKISSKSILSPGRGRESSQISLSTSLSRRLRTNGSIRSGQASPMLFTNTKKRGGFDNPEPSSPKVTCIGQVRVKTKKKHKNPSGSSNNNGTKSGTSSSFGENRELKFCQMGSQIHHHHHQDGNRNQRWVHLPVTICEALKEFNCFLPCRSSCTIANNNREQEQRKQTGEEEESRTGCGAAFTRWLVAVQEGEVRGRRIELVVGDEEEEQERESGFAITENRKSHRRHVFEDVDFEVKVEEEEARVSVCMPPKNALLLMRCRSDPVKMAALANKLWEPQNPGNEEHQENEQKQKDFEETENGQRRFELEMVDKERIQLCEKWVSCEMLEEKQNFEAETETGAETEECSVLQQEEEDEDGMEIIDSGEPVDDDSCYEDLIIAKFVHRIETDLRKELEAMSDQENPILDSVLTSPDYELEELFAENEVEEEENVVADPVNPETDPDLVNERTYEKSILPDCLLLMMCEPKLSMEVCKETWVCKTDFIKWLPERPPAAVNRKNPGHEIKKTIIDGGGTGHLNRSVKRRSFTGGATATEQVVLQPRRSSCSFPAAPPFTGVTKKAVVAAKGYEPFVLTRCKSEPVKSSSANLATEACCWKNRKLEPHRPATFGYGAAGVGF